jgi:hypothetical protein
MISPLLNQTLSANSLGTLIRILIAQRSLDILRLRFPLLSQITRDFSNESAS